MNKLILTALLAMSMQPAFAGRSLEVLNCEGVTPDLGKIGVRVFYEVKAGRNGEFGDFLGFHAVARRGQDAESFYCFGACSLVKREVVGGEVRLAVENRSLVSPALDQNLSLTVPETLLLPGARGVAHITVDLLPYLANPSIVTSSAELSCTAGTGAEFLLKSKR